jgi:hypothetical protein
MGMHEGKYYLSNSEMNHWEELCPLVWKAIYIDKVAEYLTDDEEITVRDWGVLFETLAIGTGVKGKTVDENKLESMKKSAYYPRVAQQAKDCRSFFKVLGGKITARQPYLYGQIEGSEGEEVLICGGLDAVMEFEDGRMDLIIDTKLTGDNDNDFGKYQFGNVDKVNPQQGVHYKLLYRAVNGREAMFNYFVFDKSPSMRQKVINVIVGEHGEAVHIDKCTRIYNEISFAIDMDTWGYKNEYKNCKDCPVPCKNRRVFPDVIDLNVE